MPRRHRFAEMTVAQILEHKKAGVRDAPLEDGSPSWDEIETLTWEEVDDRARLGLPGYKTIRKLLSDRRFDR